jgi:hypothetical protein
VFDHAAPVHSEVVHRWWDITWGQLNRRDVCVRTDGITFEVEVRLGGSEGKRWQRDFPTVEAAVAEAQQHLASDQEWTGIARAHRRGDCVTLKAIWICVSRFRCVACRYRIASRR